MAQASQGVEIALPADLTLTATGFLSGWSGLTDLTDSCVQIMPATTPPQNGNAPPPQEPTACPNNGPAHGIAYGLEVLLRRPLSKRLSGWLSYTLSRSTRDENFHHGDRVPKTPRDAPSEGVSEPPQTRGPCEKARRSRSGFGAPGSKIVCLAIDPLVNSRATPRNPARSRRPGST